MKKLGQQLIERGWISRGDLDRALAAQSTFGGKLCTCLLEAGAIREEQLLEALAGQRGFEPAGPDLLRSVPTEVHRLIPERLATAHRAIPIGLHRGRLAIAAVDPDDLECQDEFAFAASRKVTTSIALEIRIVEALNRYYGVACSKRFARILDRLNRARYLWAETREETRLGWESPGSQLFPEAPTLRFPVLPEIDIGPGSEAWASADEPASARSPLPPTAPPRAVPAAASAPSPGRSPQRPPSGPPAAPLSSRQQTLLATATTRDEVGRAVLIELRSHFDRAALFAALSEGIRGWMGAGPGFSPDRLAALRVPYTQPSVFLNLRRGIGFHLGPLPAMPPHRDIARCWQDQPPGSCFLLPIVVRGHLAAVVYGDRLGRSLAGLDLEAIRDLGSAAGAALERCIVLKKQTQAGARAV